MGKKLVAKIGATETLRRRLEELRAREAAAAAPLLVEWSAQGQAHLPDRVRDALAIGSVLLEVLEDEARAETEKAWMPRGSKPKIQPRVPRAHPLKGLRGHRT